MKKEINTDGSGFYQVVSDQEAIKLVDTDPQLAFYIDEELKIKFSTSKGSVKIPALTSIVEKAAKKSGIIIEV
jgi:hypothetical protein